ncbi:MAG: RsmE family RNA methyltransferase [Patescibacteria group bacterium]
MRLNRFFCEVTLDQKSTLITHAPLVNQLKNVFRLVTGDKIILFDGSGFDFISVIEGYEKDTVSFSVVEVKQNMVVARNETYLFASIVKKDNFEWIAQKATELGVSHIVPVMSERSEKKNLNMERLHKIVIEAAEQSGRGTIPEISEILGLETVLEKYSHIKSLAWDIMAEKFVSQDVAEISGAYIGPEGGWSPKELELFAKHNLKTRSLGPQVLRAETAVIAALSQMVF